MPAKKNREQIFEQKAQTILRYLKSHLRYGEDFLPRPFFLEFTGSPSSGKTTTITELDKFLRRQGFRVLRPQEGAEVIRHIPRTTPVYNIRTALYALQILIDESSGHRYDIVIFDRCIFDAYCWMEYWREKNLLSDTEKRILQSFFLSPSWMQNIDAAYIMVCEPKTAMERELRLALSEKFGETTNPETIRTLVARYQNAYRILAPEHPQLHIVDTTHIDEQTMVETIAAKILDILEQKATSNVVKTKNSP